MGSKCKCGEVLRLDLRTVMYTRNVIIRHVPVLACDDCSNYELLPCMRPVLKKCVEMLGERPSRRSFSLADHHELAGMVREVFLRPDSLSREDLELQIETEVRDRINLLLDLYSFAEQTQDHEWVENIRERLAQLSAMLPELNQFYA